MSALKTCTRCEKTLPVGDFRENKRYADGRVSWCSACQKTYRSEHYKRNKPKVQEQNAAWHQANKESRNRAMADAYRDDPAKHIERVNEAKKRAPDAYREKNRINARRRRVERIDVRLRSRISSQFRYCLGTGKGGAATESLLGYSIHDLRVHLERQFLPGMDWRNMGEWHIDHIVPLASFTITGPDDPELRRAWALTNLRPLWAADNIRKGATVATLL